MLKIEMLNIMNSDHDCDSETDVGSDDQATQDECNSDVEWAVKNQHIQLNCLFQDHVQSTTPWLEENSID